MTGKSKTFFFSLAIALVFSLFFLSSCLEPREEGEKKAVTTEKKTDTAANPPETKPPAQVKALPPFNDESFQEKGLAYIYEETRATALSSEDGKNLALKGEGEKQAETRPPTQVKTSPTVAYDLSGERSPADISAKKAKTIIKKMDAAPFPYNGKYADTNELFFDYIDPKTKKQYHTNRYGKRFAKNEHYGDNSVLFYFPKDFTPERPFCYLIYFHGNQTNIKNEFRKFKLKEQIDRAGKNIVFICPQLAKNAMDSSPGKFFRKNKFREFFKESADILTKEFGSQYAYTFKHAPIILVAFSGGYKSVAYILDRGGLGFQVKAVLLLDALFEDTEKYGNWFLTNNNNGIFFLSIFSKYTETENNNLRGFIENNQLKSSDRWPDDKIENNYFYFIKSNIAHLRIPVQGPPKYPLTNFIKKLPPYDQWQSAMGENETSVDSPVSEGTESSLFRGYR